MKTKLVKLETSERLQMIDITSIVEKFVKEEKPGSTLCCVYVPHTTAGVTVNENTDPRLREDILAYLDKLVPKDASYGHSSTPEAHIMATLTGNTQMFLVENNKLILGQWQAIYFCEYSGPRSRNVYLRIQ